MKTFNFPKATLTLLALSATLMFTGCSGEGADMSANSQVLNAHANNNGAAAQTPVQTPRTADEDVVSKVSPEEQQAFLDLVNAARAQTQDCGSRGVFDPAPALTWSKRLDNAAYEHSNDMAQSNTFSHEGSASESDLTAQDWDLGRGSKFYERIRNQGYTQYRRVGENIAAGYESAQEAVDAWLASDDHCANLMDPIFTEMGMVKVSKDGSDYGTYWSQEFGGK